MTPGDSVERAIEECGARGCPLRRFSATASLTPGGRRGAQARLVARARTLGVRVLAQQHGAHRRSGRAALTVNAVLEMDVLPRDDEFVSQSGTMLGTVLSRGAARGLGFAKLVSVGNESDLGMAELSSC